MLNEFNTINYSPSCERNKHVIVEQLQNLLANSKNVLEIGSLSGQHAAHFCEQLPHLKWQPSDLYENLAALRHNLKLVGNAKIESPLKLDVSDFCELPTNLFDTVFTANTLHIMSWQHVQSMFENIGCHLKSLQTICIYGPFKYQQKFTSESNANFELWLKSRDVNSGIRDFERVNSLANNIGFTLDKDITMPANNQLIVWRK